MRKSITSILTVLVATALLLTGCDPILPSGGKSVKFTATSRSQVTTKTAYSGNIDAETKREAIYWDGNDKIRIYSSDTEVVATPNGTDYAEYSLEVSATPTHANLVNDASNGLAWKQSGEVTFYAVYPPSTSGSTVGIFDMGIPTTQAYKVPTETVMDHAYMLAKNKLSGMNDVSLNFYPAFTAFQINLKSLDDELTLKEFRIFYLDPNDLENEDDIRLSGPYWGGIDADNNMSFLRYPYNDEFSSSFVDPDYDDFSQVRVAFTKGTKVTSGTNGTAVNFTLFTLPFMGGITGDPILSLTNLWLEVSFWKNDEDGNPTGDLIIKKLALKQNDEFYQFDACKKYRINGLAVDGGSKWKLDIDGQVLPWQGYEAKIDDQVSIMPESFKIFGAIESTSQWQNYEIIEGTDPVQYKNAAGNNKANHYYDSNWVPFGREGYGQGEDNYDKKYQLRYLNRDGQGYFTVQFTPTAPTGGYWQLIPTFKDGDTMSPNHFRFEVVHPGGAVSDQLKGQILYQPVTIRIYPKDYAFSDQNIYDMWFTCYFSPSSSFTPSISADSEFQDVHGDGRFSYWVFRLAPYEGHFVDE